VPLQQAIRNISKDRKNKQGKQQQAAVEVEALHAFT